MYMRFAWCIFLLPCAALLAADESARRASDKRALAPLQSFVGDWRGVGQVRRGSNEGAWIEASQWAWKFDKAGAALSFVCSDAKYVAAGEIRPTDEAGQFQLVTKPADGDQRISYTGESSEGGEFVFEADEPSMDQPARISFRHVAEGKRLVVLYERKSAGGDRFTRLAEVGYTRQGSDFGKGTTFVECVVTGGKGTIPVNYKGTTYHVCCSGCRELFEEDPEGVLAEYRASKAKKR